MDKTKSRLYPRRATFVFFFFFEVLEKFLQLSTLCSRFSALRYVL